MCCRTDTSWLYCSRGEVSFLNHRSWMKIGSWTMLVYSVAFVPLNLDYCDLSLRFEVRTCAMPTSFFRVICHKFHTRGKPSYEPVCLVRHLFLLSFLVSRSPRQYGPFPCSSCK